MRFLRQILAGMLAPALLAIPAWHLAPNSAAAAPLGVSIADYRGTDEVFVNLDGREITQREIFLYALLFRTFDAELLTEWEELGEEGRKQLRRAIIEYLMLLDYEDRYLATARTAEELDREYRAERIGAIPVARMIWADTVVRENVRVFPEDLYFEYLSSGDELAEPAEVNTRMLRVPLEPPITSDTIRRARERAQSLRLEAIRTGGLGPLLQRYPEYAPENNGGGYAGTFTFVQGSADADTPMGRRAFLLGLAQISQPIQTSDAFYLIEVEDRTAGEPPPLTEVGEELREELISRFIPLQFEYMSTMMQIRAFPINRAHLFPFLADDAHILRVRGFSLTREEFMRLYPERIGAADEPNKEAIAITVADIVAGEVVTQDLERKRLLYDEPFYDQGREIARLIFRASEYVREQAKLIDPTEEEIELYLAENQEQIFPSVAKVVWTFELSPRDREALRPGELSSLQILMEGHLRHLLTQARQQLAERAEVIGALPPDPSIILRALPPLEDTRIRLRFEMLGTYNVRQLPPDVEASFDELQVGEFTSPRTRRNGAVVSYYVSDEVESTPPPDEVLFQMARNAYLAEKVQAETIEHLTRLERQGRLTFHPELGTEPPIAKE